MLPADLASPWAEFGGIRREFEKSWIAFHGEATENEQMELLVAA